MIQLYSKIFENIGWKAGSDLLVKMIRMGFTIVAIRLMEPAVFGKYSYFFTLTFVIVQFTDFGLNVYLTREVSKNISQLRKLFRCALTIKYIFTSILWALIVIVWLILYGFAGDIYIFFILLCAQILNSYIDLAIHLFRGIQQLHFEAKLNLLNSIFLVVFGVPTILLSGGALGLSIALLCAALITFGLAVYCLHLNYIPTKDWFRLELNDSSLQGLREIAPIGTAILLSSLYFRSDLLLLQFYLGPEAVALYTAALKMLEGFMFIPSVALAGIFPAFAQLTTQKNSEIHDLFKKSLFGLFLISNLLCIIVAVYSHAIIHFLYGANYEESANVLMIFAPAIIFIFINFSLTHFLIALGGQRYYALYCAACGVFNIAGNGLFIPLFGINGAASIKLLTEVLLCAFVFPKVLKYLRP